MHQRPELPLNSVHTMLRNRKDARKVVPGAEVRDKERVGNRKPRVEAVPVALAFLLSSWISSVSP